jgi:hypothetical protein
MLRPMISRDLAPPTVHEWSTIVPVPLAVSPRRSPLAVVAVLATIALALAMLLALA